MLRVLEKGQQPLEEPDCLTGEELHLKDVQQLLVIKEEFPLEPRVWNPSCDQEDQKPPQIKEEQEEADIIEFTFSPETVKNEDDEEKPWSSEPDRSRNEENRDSLGPESDPEAKNSATSETDISDRAWEERHNPPSGLNSAEVKDVSVGGARDDGDKTLNRCSECGKTFKRRQYLLQHNRIHTGGKPFICSVCNTAFTWKHILVQHMRVHTGEKPFSCSVCRQSFKHKVSLNSHKRCHTGEKPYMCSDCKATFKWCTSLMRHKKTHTGEKPFSCSVCDADFVNKRELVKHTRQHK